jgi:hypothetical protein
MTLPEALDTTRIHRVAGRTGDRTAVVTTRPCRAPPHTISDVGRIGGGQVPMPGEVSRAHHGVLFVDARPEGTRYVLEVLRQPPEDGVLCRQSLEHPRPRHAACALDAVHDLLASYPSHSLFDELISARRRLAVLEGSFLPRLAGA